MGVRARLCTNFHFLRSNKCIDNCSVKFCINLIDNCDNCRLPILTFHYLLSYFLIYNNVYQYFTLWPFDEFSKKGISLPGDDRKLQTFRMKAQLIIRIISNVTLNGNYTHTNRVISFTFQQPLDKRKRCGWIFLIRISIALLVPPTCGSATCPQLLK